MRRLRVACIPGRHHLLMGSICSTTSPYGAHIYMYFSMTTVYGPLHSQCKSQPLYMEPAFTRIMVYIFCTTRGHRHASFRFNSRGVHTSSGYPPKLESKGYVRYCRMMERLDFWEKADPRYGRLVLDLITWPFLCPSQEFQKGKPCCSKYFLFFFWLISVLWGDLNKHQQTADHICWEHRNKTTWTSIIRSSTRSQGTADRSHLMLEALCLLRRGFGFQYNTRQCNEVINPFRGIRLDEKYYSITLMSC